MAKLEVYKAKNGETGWRVRASNKLIVAVGGETFKRPSGARQSFRRALNTIFRAAKDAKVPMPPILSLNPHPQYPLPLPAAEQAVTDIRDEVQGLEEQIDGADMFFDRGSAMAKLARINEAIERYRQVMDSNRPEPESGGIVP